MLERKDYNNGRPCQPCNEMLFSFEFFKMHKMKNVKISKCCTIRCQYILEGSTLGTILNSLDFLPCLLISYFSFFLKIHMYISNTFYPIDLFSS